MHVSENNFTDDSGQVARLVNPQGSSSVLLVCEHASNFMPSEYGGLGLPMMIRPAILLGIRAHWHFPVILQICLMRGWCIAQYPD